MASSYKPPAPKTTSGNKQTPQPISPNRKIIGRYKVKPVKVPKGLLLKKRGGDKGWVTVRAPAAGTPSPGAPAAPKTPSPKTYPEYADYPFAQQMMAGIDRDEASHIAHSGQVADWLKGGLVGLTGVDPSAPGYNPQVQQQYLANIAGQVGGALNAAATATPGAVMPTTPGGMTVGNMGFLGNAAREASAQRSSAALQMAQARSALNTMTPNIYAQGAMRAFADMQAGLPSIYATRRNEARTKIEEFIEEARHNRVTEATNAWNAQTNAAIAFGNLGLDASKLGADQAADTLAASQPVPPGFVRLPNGDYRTDPTYDTGGSGSGRGGGTSTRDGQGRLRVPSLNEQGYTRYGDKPPKKYDKTAFRVVPGADGGYWIKRIKEGGSGPKATTGTSAFQFQKDLQKAVANLTISTDDQNTGTGDMLRFLREHQPAKPGKAWDNWWLQIFPVIERVDPDLAAWMSGYKRRREQGVGGVRWTGKF